MSHEQNVEKIKSKLKNWLCLPLCEARIVLCSRGEQSMLLLGSARKPAALAEPTAVSWSGTWCDTKVSLATWHQSWFVPWCLGIAGAGFGSRRDTVVASVRSSYKWKLKQVCWQDLGPHLGPMVEQVLKN